MVTLFKVSTCNNAKYIYSQQMDEISRFVSSVPYKTALLCPLKQFLAQRVSLSPLHANQVTDI